MVYQEIAPEGKKKKNAVVTLWVSEVTLQKDTTTAKKKIRKGPKFKNNGSGVVCERGK